MSEPKVKAYFAGLTRNTFLLAVASLFTDISTEMLYPVLPVFLTETLRASGSIVGVVDGFALAGQNIVQGFSGVLSDRWKRHKAVAVVGYVLAATAKPLIGLSTVWQGLFAARLVDRVGTGIRSAPRDALVAESVEAKDRGRAFGLEGLGDNTGAFLGPLLALFLLVSVGVGLRTVFYLALIPGLVAVGMVLLVQEKPRQDGTSAAHAADARRFPAHYWRYLSVIALFGIGNSSNAFLILRTHETGTPLRNTILIYAGFNLMAALISYPAGSLSDRWNRKHVLLIAFVIFAVVYAGFGLTTNIALLGVLFLLYGVYQGIFRAVGKAIAADAVPVSLRASGIGWYSTAVGLSQLAASIVAGVLWDRVGHDAVFFYGAAFAVAGTVGLALLDSQPAVE
ncbi:MAG TPA: MFS transporter [Edaphobacter sp.]|nr:MFS transporter [Edaphobacter sp.]